MIEYYKNKSLEPLFYINKYGLVCQEKFKDIPNYEGFYQASDLGRIKSLSRIAVRKKGGNYKKETMILNQKIYVENQYAYVNLYKSENKKYSVHQLIAITFLNHIPCRYKFVVDHINNIKADNRLENIQIVTNRVNTTKERQSDSLGVTWVKSSKKWQSTMVINGAGIHLGVFKEKDLAVKAYLIALENIDKYEGNNIRFRALIKNILKDK
jgi:hypothetical protein